MLSKKAKIKNRQKIIIFIISSIFLILSAVLLNISYTKNSFYTQKASQQHISDIVIRPCRGEIFDRNLIPFTDTQKSSYLLTANGVIKNENPTDNRKIIGSSYSFDIFSRYSDTSLMHHLIGYLNSDYSGASGVEKLFNKELSTNKSILLKYINTAVGKPTYNNTYGLINDDFVSNSNIKLTIDYKIQKTVEEQMNKYIKKGAVAVIDVQSFDVLALASRPDFDVTDIENILSSDSTALINRAFSAYNAGSIFKIITACSALENSMYNNNSMFECSGGLNYNDRFFCCNGIHNKLNFKTAFAKSCNTAFYNIGINIGGECICNMAKRFYMGQTITNLPELESNGNVPTRSVYQSLENINLSIGQGELLITPLQAANIACIIANRGTAKSINIADSVVDKNGAMIKNLKNKSEKKVITRDIADNIANMMRETVVEGTAQQAQNGIVAIAGKTGTAQTGWYNDVTKALNVHGWFIGYFPFDNPKYAMAVFSENGQSGSESCIPAFKNIALEIMNF